jgi:hypothetical protein
MASSIPSNGNAINDHHPWSQAHEEAHGGTSHNELAVLIVSPKVHQQFILNPPFRGGFAQHSQCTLSTMKDRLVPLRVARVWHDIPTGTAHQSAERNVDLLFAGEVPPVAGPNSFRRWAHEGHSISEAAGSPDRSANSERMRMGPPRSERLGMGARVVWIVPWPAQWPAYGPRRGRPDLPLTWDFSDHRCSVQPVRALPGRSPGGGRQRRVHLDAGASALIRVAVPSRPAD